MSRSNVEIPDNVQSWVGEEAKYKEGFFTQLATDELASGINEDVVRAISASAMSLSGCWSSVCRLIMLG